MAEDANLAAVLFPPRQSHPVYDKYIHKIGKVLTAADLIDFANEGWTFKQIVDDGRFIVPKKLRNPPAAVAPLITLPGHSYLGPGNSLSGQTPLDLDDSIAQEHDLAYAHAVNPKDIEEADNIFIHDSISDVLETGNIHSIIGGVGIAAKKAIEKVTGPLYPNLGKWVSYDSHLRLIYLLMSIF
jgi:hypothetical protein